MEEGIKRVLIVDDFATVPGRLIAMLSKAIRAKSIDQGEGAPGRINSIHRLDADAVIPDIRMPSGIQMEMLMIRVHSLLN